MVIFNRSKESVKDGNGTPLQPTFYPLNVDDLHLADYQRGLKKSRSKRMAEQYDPDIFGIVLVSYREGKYWIVDGQHRVECCRMRGIKTVLCQVLEGLTYEEEASKFYEVNNSRVRLTANHKFNARVERKDADALSIVRALNRYKFTYAKEMSDQGDNCVRAVGTLEKIYKESGYSGLCEVLEILRKAWNGDSKSLMAEIIRGLNTFVSNYDYDKRFLIRALESNTPWGISNRAKGSVNNLSRPDRGVCFHIAKTIRDLYEDYAITSKTKIKPCTLKAG